MFLFVFRALITLFSTLSISLTPAVAADFYAPAYNWTGFYIGGQAGLATGNTQGDPDLPFGPPELFSTDYSIDGALYGGHVGYNFQAGNLVFGLEGTFDGSSIQGNTACVLVLECEREVNWVGTLVGRIGYAQGPAMVYGLGGVAWAAMDTEVSIAGVSLLSGDDTHTGWVLGGGLAYAVSDNIIARIEYAHMDFGSETHVLADGPFTVDDDVDAKLDTVRIGVSFKFGGVRSVAPPPPLK